MKRSIFLLIAALSSQAALAAQEERLTPPPAGGYPTYREEQKKLRAVGNFFPLDPAGAYVPSTQDPQPHAPSRVDLNGIPAGTILSMRQVGTFETAPGFPDNSVGLAGLFIDANGRHLPPGAHTTARDSITSPVDIRKDFLLGYPFEFNQPAYDVEVPEGAVAILFSPGDGYVYWDNIDPNGDWGVLISVKTPVPTQTEGDAPCNSDNPNVDSCPHPVVIATGQMWHSQEDIRVPGRTLETPLLVTRTYTSNSVIERGRFGRDWRDNYETKLVPAGGGAIFDITWVDQTGGAYLFKHQTDGSYLTPAGYRFTLLEFPDHYEIRKPNRTAYHFSKNADFGRLIKIVESHGEELTFSYDGSGRLISVSTPFAGSLVYSYNSSGLVQQITRSRDNLTYTYAYNADDRLIAASDFNQRTFQYSYVDDKPGTLLQGKLKAIEDPIGRVLSYTYDDKGRVATVSEPGGGLWKYAYGDHTTYVREPNGGTTRYIFDAEFHTQKVVLPDGTRLIDTWQNGLKTATLIEQGGTTRYGYDANNNVNSIKRPEDIGPTRTTFDLNFNKPVLIEPLVGAPTQFILDAFTGDVTGMSRGGLSLTFTRDAFGKVLSTNNGRAIYADERDENGFLTKVFDLHNPETRTYDTRGRVATRSFQSGRTLSYAYDDYDRVIVVSDSHGPSTTSSYDAVGRLTQSTKSVGGTSEVTAYQYDDRDRIVSITDALNRTTTFQYDPIFLIPKPKSVTDPAGRITYFEYDSRERLVKKTEANGAITRFTYDNRGNLTSVTDANGGRTMYSYDLNDRKIRELRQSVAGSSAAERVTHFFWDQGNHLVHEIVRSATGGQDRTVAYQYDSLDRLVKRTVQREGHTGPIVEDESNFSYENQLDTLLLKTAVNGVANLGFTNEAAPPFLGTGFSVAASQSGNPLGLIEGDFSITRDVTGEIATVAKDGNILFSRTFDPAGRLTGVTAGSFSTSIGYNGFGLKSSVVHSDGSSGSFQYDLLQRLVSVSWSGAAPISEQLSYDPLTGNIVSIERENGTYTLAHDAIDQIVSSSTTGSANYNRTWSYSLSGDRVGDSQNGNGTYINHFLISNGVSSFWADPNGFGDVVRETSGAMVKNFGYRADGLMNSFQSGSTQASYYFDALNRRVAKALQIGSSTFTQSYLHLDKEDRILMAKAGDGSITTYLDGLGVDEHLAEGKNGVFKGYVTDHLGSLLNGEAAGSTRSFGIWGEQIAATTISVSSNPVMYGFTGREHDAESGLDYHRARSRNKAVGTWMSQESIGVDGPNLYRYVKNDPSGYIDPSGFSASMPFDPGATDFCGSSSNGSEWVPDSPGGVDFSQACFIHDNCYSNPKKTKAQCDIEFLGNLLAACESATSDAGKPLCQTVAQLYTIAVQAAAEDAYKEAQKGSACKNSTPEQ